MSKKEGKKRRVFNLYNFAVLFCLILIIGSIIILFETHSEKLPREWTEKYAEIRSSITGKFDEWTQGKEDNTKLASANESKNEMNTANRSNNQSINSVLNEEDNKETENKISVKPGDANETAAKMIAISKFKELGETDITESNLQIMTIQRDGQDYYYITSSKNSMEIHIATGKTTRINSIPVEE